MASTVVFDLDEVLLGGDASTLFLHGRLRQSPRRLLLAAPLLLPGALVPQLRPLSARVMTGIAVGGRSGSDVEAVTGGSKVTRLPSAGTRRPGRPRTATAPRTSRCSPARLARSW